MLFGHVHNTKPALTNLLEKSVTADLRSGTFADPRVFDSRSRVGGGLEEMLFRLVDSQERLNTLAECLIAAANLVEIVVAVAWILPFASNVEDCFLV